MNQYLRNHSNDHLVFGFLICCHLCQLIQTLQLTIKYYHHIQSSTHEVHLGLSRGGLLGELQGRTGKCVAGGDAACAQCTCWSLWASRMLAFTPDQGKVLPRQLLSKGTSDTFHLLLSVVHTDSTSQKPATALEHNSPGVTSLLYPLAYSYALSTT